MSEWYEVYEAENKWKMIETAYDALRQYMTDHPDTCLDCSKPLKEWSVQEANLLLAIIEVGYNMAAGDC